MEGVFDKDTWTQKDMVKHLNSIGVDKVSSKSKDQLVKISEMLTRMTVAEFQATRAINQKKEPKSPRELQPCKEGYERVQRMMNVCRLNEEVKAERKAAAVLKAKETRASKKTPVAVKKTPGKKVVATKTPGKKVVATKTVATKTPSKKTRGRPKKVEEVEEVEEDEDEDEDEDEEDEVVLKSSLKKTATKKTPGRPRKVVFTDPLVENHRKTAAKSAAKKKTAKVFKRKIVT